jgi:DNA-binding NarL/FixJ family response regulator
MQDIRTVTVALTPLLSDIIKELVAEQAPIDIVASLDRSDQLAPCLYALAPDLVLIGLERNEGDGLSLSLRNAIPRATVIGLSHDASHAYLLEPHRHRAMPIEMSPEALIEAIRHV